MSQTKKVYDKLAENDCSTQGSIEHLILNNLKKTWPKFFYHPGAFNDEVPGMLSAKSVQKLFSGLEIEIGMKENKLVLKKLIRPLPR